MAALKLCLALALVACVTGQGAQNQLNKPTLNEQRQRALFAANGSNPYVLSINTLTAPALTENAAFRTSLGNRDAFPILATVPGPGSAIYISTLKPCGIVLPHVHPRATESYLVVSGTLSTGLAEENGAKQNTTADVRPGQVSIAPQGLVHYLANKGCSPVVFVQIFDNADPGTLTLGTALAALSNVDPEVIGNAYVNATASPLGGNALNQQCLQRCGLGAGGGGFGSLSQELQTFIGTAAAAPSSG